MQLVGWGVVLGLILGVSIYLLQDREVIQHVEASGNAALASEFVEEKPEPQVVLIEVRVNWTPERIAQEIDKVFPDAPIMHKVMACESGGDIEAYNPTNNSHDNGLLQISDLYHGREVRSLGLDVGDPSDNIAFARILYDRNGLRDWSASKHCWSK